MTTSPAAARRDDGPTGGRLSLVPGGLGRAAERSAAVVDLGSNSWRYVAYRYVPNGAWRSVRKAQEPVRIARGLAVTGKIDADRLERGMEALAMFARYSRADGVRADDASLVATSALRDASNGAAAIDRMQARTGLAIRTLSAEEEAHYGYLAAVNSTTLADGLALDLGGGSVQLVSVRDRAATEFASWPLGAVRVTEALLPGGDALSRKQLKRVRLALREQFDGVPEPGGGGRVVAMGGAARNLAAAAMRARHAPPVGLQGAVVTAGELHALVGTLARRRSDRRALPGIKSSRADIILGAALVLEAVLDLTGAGALEVTRAGLREGVFIAEHLLGGRPPILGDVREAAVRNLAGHHAVDLRRAEHVAALALGLHDSLTGTGVIAPGPDERELLWSAAMLHEIGVSINLDSHPLHARFLLLNSELYGFGPREAALIAQIVRHHRKGAPSLGELAAVTRPGDHALLSRCAVTIRLAAQLACGGDEAGREPRLVQGRGGLRLRVPGDKRLARWTLERHAGDDAFEAAFGRPLVGAA